MITLDNKTQHGIVGALVGSLTLVLLWYVFLIAPVSYSDWHVFFWPAIREWLDPYANNQGTYNPPWAFAMLAPLATVFGERGAVAAVYVVSVLGVALYVRSPIKVLLVVMSPPFLSGLVVGQLDGLVLLGMAIPHGLGVPMIMIKPQSALLTIVPRLNRASIGVTVAVILLSLATWGFWWHDFPLRTVNPDPPRNLSLFPWSLALVPVLTYYGLKQKSDTLLCVATLCLAPFFQLHSVLPTFAAATKEMSVRRAGLLLVMAWVVFVWLRL